MSNQSILSLSNLGKQYHGRWVVRNLNLQISSSEIYGFLGRNGSGKTTTIRMVMGLIQPSAGQVQLFSQSPSELGPDMFNRVAATIEYPGFYQNLTARENLLYQAKMYSISPKKVDEMLHFFGLSNAAHRLTKEFSLGMKQRLGLARAMLHEPKLLILDEPTNGLDPAGIQEIRQTIKQLNREKGITILFSSHILSEVEQISTRVGIINAGTLVDEFSLDQFHQDNKQIIEIRLSDAQAACELIQDTFSPTTQWESSPSWVVDKETGLVHVPGTLSAPHVINRLLVENGLEVHHLVTYRETLEDRFMRLTGGNDHAELD